jgi:hypothetical protein
LLIEGLALFFELRKKTDKPGAGDDLKNQNGGKSNEAPFLTARRPAEVQFILAASPCVGRGLDIIRRRYLLGEVLAPSLFLRLLASVVLLPSSGSARG